MFKLLVRFCGCVWDGFKSIFVSPFVNFYTGVKEGLSSDKTVLCKIGGVGLKTLGLAWNVGVSLFKPVVTLGVFASDVVFGVTYGRDDFVSKTVRSAAVGVGMVWGLIKFFYCLPGLALDVVGSWLLGAFDGATMKLAYESGPTVDVKEDQSVKRKKTPIDVKNEPVVTKKVLEAELATTATVVEGVEVKSQEVGGLEPIEDEVESSGVGVTSKVTPIETIKPSSVHVEVINGKKCTVVDFPEV